MAEEKKFWQGVGRRKTAVAVVKIFKEKEGPFLVNEKPLEKYFPLFELQKTAKAPLELLKLENKFKILAQVRGGGLVAQSEAIRLGLARALVSFKEEFRKKLKKAGFLKRDPRVKERKKPGLKRARRAPQWQKR
jgi:small subunit ribosomal protein S9